MLSSSISNLGYKHYLNEKLDRCSDVSDLKKLILLSKAKKRCYSPAELERYNDVVKFESQNHSTKKDQSCVTVLKDDIIDWTRRNPECSTLAQWELICNEIRLKYKLDISIEEIQSNSVNLLLDIESNHNIKANIYNLILDIKSKPSSPSSTLEFETIKKNIPSFSLSTKEYERFSSKFKLTYQIVSNIYKLGMKLNSKENELNLQINTNNYPLKNINPIGLQLQVK